VVAVVAVAPIAGAVIAVAVALNPLKLPRVTGRQTLNCSLACPALRHQVRERYDYLLDVNRRRVR
jgi:hypothetical protein